MFSANIFALLEAENKTLVPLNRADVTDLPLFRTLLDICQKPHQPSSQEAITLLFY